jgi:6-phosphogluconate dehydrogenase (decarboxylating)
MCLLGVYRADPWWFVHQNHQDLPPDGTLVVGGDTDPDLLKIADVWRRGSSCTAWSTTLLIDLLPQSAATEGVSCALVVGARYVEWITAGARLDLEVAR